MKQVFRTFTIAIIIIILSSPLSLFSAEKQKGEKQKSEKQKSVTDLKKELDSLSGKKKADHLNLLARHTFAKSPEESLSYSKKALKLSQELDYTLGKSRAFIRHAFYHRRKRQYQEALDYFKEAKEGFTKLDIPNNIGACQVDIGHMYKRLRQHEKALVSHKESLKTYQKMGKEALSAWSFYHCGNDYLNMEKHDEALDYYNRSLKLFNKLERKDDAANVLCNMAYTYSQTGEHAKALKKNEEAIALYTETGNKEDIALCRGNIGVIYDLTGQYSLSIKSHLQSLKIYEEIGDQSGVSMALNNIGVIYKNMDKYDEALEYYQKAVVIEEKHGKPTNVSHIYNNIGSIFKNKKDYPKAMENYQKGLRISEKYKHKRTIALSYTNIGTLLKRRQQYPQSLNYLQKALKLNKEIGNQYSIAVDLYNIGEIYVDQNQLNTAFTYINQALEQAKKMDVKDLVRECYDSLSILNTKKKNYKKALEYYKLWVQKKDEIINKETSTKIAEMKTGYEIEKKEQRIALLEKDNLLLTKNSEIQLLTISKERFKSTTFIAGFILVLFIILLFFRKYLHLFAFWKKKNYIGHYKIVDQIGAGGMGIIYKASDLMNKSDPVAIKVIREEFSKDELQRKRFLNEALTVDQLDHPNIIKVYERGEHNQQLYMAMEMLDGPSLAQIIEKNEKLPIQDCLVIMNQLILAIHRIHTKGIVHRDLKPDNIIIIQKEGNKNFVKLLDFGLARGQNLSSLTGKGEIIGTINYLPPEQISSREFTSASDIYSLGVVFYELVTLEKPFIGELPVDIIKQILDKEPIQPIQLRPDLTPEINELITQMLAKQPDSRPSEEVIMETLEQFQMEAAT